MREDLVKRLDDLKANITKSNNAVFAAYCELQTAKEQLQDKEDSLLKSGVIDGKNAELRAVQMREATEQERQAVAKAEHVFEGAKVISKNRQTDLQIALALVELYKGVA